MTLKGQGDYSKTVSCAKVSSVEARERVREKMYMHTTDSPLADSKVFSLI